MTKRAKQFIGALFAEIKDPKLVERVRAVVEEHKELFELTKLERYLVHENEAREQRSSERHSEIMRAVGQLAAPVFATLSGYVAAKTTPPAPSVASAETPEAAFDHWIAGVGVLFCGLSRETKHDVLFTILEHANALPNQAAHARKTSLTECLSKVKMEVGAKTFEEVVSRPGRALFEARGMAAHKE